MAGIWAFSGGAWVRARAVYEMKEQATTAGGGGLEKVWKQAIEMYGLSGGTWQRGSTVSAAGTYSDDYGSVDVALTTRFSTTWQFGTPLGTEYNVVLERRRLGIDGYGNVVANQVGPWTRIASALALSGSWHEVWAIRSNASGSSTHQRFEYRALVLSNSSSAVLAAYSNSSDLNNSWDSYVGAVSDYQNPTGPQESGAGT